jgi:two-component system, NarL family, nitrate/nitrite response regulator NarL
MEMRQFEERRDVKVVPAEMRASAENAVLATARAEIARLQATVREQASEIGALRGYTPPPELTPREAEILALIDRGLSNKDIARQLHVELATVKNHVHHILEKLHVHRRGEAAAIAAGRVRRAS